MKKQAWIYSPTIDSLFILSPPFLCLLAIFLFNPYFQTSEVSPIAWVLLVLSVDVAHVYSTLFRTYFDKEIFERNKNVLIYIPIITLIAGIVLYEIEAMLFWRVLAYLAVFHFIRQQYGFMRIYSRKESNSTVFKIIDNSTIYYSTLYPIIHWHTTQHIQFHWFIDGDFALYHNSVINQLSWFLYIVILSVYFAKEAYWVYKTKFLNIPKNLIVIGTILSWYFGIVYFNSDLIFTALNVLSHGIPYMALVWIYGKKRYNNPKKSNTIFILNKVFHTYGLPIFLIIILLFAYVEEGLWDGLVWKDHTEVFPFFAALPQINNKDYLAFLVPLLSLPQAAHYLIDGYIWKVSKEKID